MTIDRVDLEALLQRFRVDLESRSNVPTVPTVERTPDQQYAFNVQRLYAVAGAPQRKDALWAFAFDFLGWWHEAGRTYYGRGCVHEDDGLRHAACDAVLVLGGWRVARALLRTLASGALYRPQRGFDPKADLSRREGLVRGIIVRPEPRSVD